jgi:tetratricopeptide (TPR) repeat protein
LGDELRADPFSSPELALEAVDVLGRILRRMPDDSEAMVMMADVSFDQRAFSKAEELYKKYLEQVPGDVGARARYASTLTFLGKFDDSIRELDGILIKEPKNFPAKAYLAITYAQQGNIDKAKAVAQEALDLAPSQEARERFSAFVTSLESAPKESSDETPGPMAESGNGAPFENPIVAAVRNNPVAGSKFVRAESEGDGTLRLFFSDFPMQAMPPFAKEKFFQGIKDKAAAQREKTFRRVVFLDEKSGTEMDTIDLQ